MIKRYSRKELTDIWSEENKYKIWLEVEVAAAEAMEKLGRYVCRIYIPFDDLELVQNSANYMG